MASRFEMCFKGILFSLFVSLCFSSCSSQEKKKPMNILVLHTDQWRAQAMGYRGDPKCWQMRATRPDIQANGIWMEVVEAHLLRPALAGRVFSIGKHWNVHMTTTTRRITPVTPLKRNFGMAMMPWHKQKMHKLI